MTTRLLIWNYLKEKPLQTLLNIFLLSLGISVITLIILFNNQLQEKIISNARGIDLVVGAKGSPLQLILCNIFHIDFPTGNIKLIEADRLAKHRLVKSAIPLALGDSYNSFRIVGTNKSYANLYQATLNSGAWWSKDLEVTVGVNVAKSTNLKIGDSFTSSHGLTKDGHAHEEKKYIITGILNPSGSVLDNLLLTNVKSIWLVHEESNTPQPIANDTVHQSRLIPSVSGIDSTREITSLLIKYKNPMAIITLPRFINTQTNMQAASPAFETARLFTILGEGIDALKGLAYLLVFISALSIFIALYNSLKERKYDLAIMRSMGASPRKLFQLIIFEGISLTMLGVLVGLILGHFTVLLFANFIDNSQHVGFTSLVFYKEEVFILLGGLVVGFLCSLLPAIQAYRTDIHKVLAGN